MYGRREPSCVETEMKKQNVKIELGNGRHVEYFGEAQVTDEDVASGIAQVLFTEPYESDATKPMIPAAIIPADTPPKVEPVSSETETK